MFALYSRIWMEIYLSFMGRKLLDDAERFETPENDISVASARHKLAVVRTKSQTRHLKFFNMTFTGPFVDQIN